MTDLRNNIRTRCNTLSGIQGLARGLMRCRQTDRQTDTFIFNQFLHIT